MKGLIALSPLGVFVILYLVTSIIAGDFYKMPITVAFMASSIYAVAIFRGRPLKERIEIFSRGAASNQMMLMVWIFLLAGAFANSAKQMGSIDATVNLTLNLLPSQMLLAGLFLAACFISISIGTSVGTIVALTPIAVGVAQQTGTDVALMTAVVVGGSFFGDNLSFISDTTIVATSTQGCKLNDKFRVNSFIVIPAALIILIVYYFMGSDIHAVQEQHAVKWVKVIPFMTDSFDVFGWMKAMGDGMVGMGELIIITMVAGGMLELIKQQGGIDFIMQRMVKHIRNKRGAELSIGALVGLTDICTANNTVAIITVGSIAKQIGDRYGVDNKKAASILDTSSCFVQGLIPYGAQLLIAAGLAAISPVSIMPFLFYPFAIGIATLLSILFRYPRRYS